MRKGGLVARIQRDESGFTLMELMMAATLCAVGLMAMISAFDGSRDLVNAAEHNEVASQRAERALEDAVARPYDQIGLQGTTAPSPSSDPNHPNNRVTVGGNYIYRVGSPSSPLVFGGTLPRETPWQDSANRLRGTVYYYVTQYRDLGLDPTGATVHGKRITVAVTVRGRRRPVTTSTIVRVGG